MNSVHDILNAITEAKVAFDERPVLQSRIDELSKSLDKSMHHAQELELKLMERNATIDALQSKCRSLEVERDDMGFRELEAQDKLDALRNVVKTFTAAAESLMPKVVEVAQAEPVSESIPVNPTTPSTQDQSSSGGQTTQAVPQSGELSGQSESPLPQSAPSMESQSTSVPLNVESTASASQAKPYEGKTYSQVGLRINVTDWVNGGGTEADYWR